MTTSVQSKTLSRRIANGICVAVATFVTLGYLIFMLLWPCMPVTDASREIVAVSRAELWMIHAAFPQTIWTQWTGDSGTSVLSSLSDRLPVVVATAIWFLVAWPLGRSLLMMDRLADDLSVTEQQLLSYALGSVVLSGCVFLNGVTFGPQSLFGLLVWTAGALVLAFAFAARKGEAKSVGMSMVAQEEHADDSLDASWRRRLIGLTLVGSCWIAAVVMLGAMIPSQDADVREVDLMALREFYSRNRIEFLADQTECNLPMTFQMPTLAMMGCYGIRLDQADNAISGATSGYVLSALVGQSVRAVLWLMTMGLVAVHLRRRWGLLSSVIVFHLLVALPGMQELVRLGRSEVAIALWPLVTLVVLSAMHRSTAPPRGMLSLGVIASGAFGAGYWSGFIVGLPIAILCLIIGPSGSTLTSASSSVRLRCIILFLIATIGGSGWLIKNAIASGDPVYPWLTVWSVRPSSKPEVQQWKTAWQNTHGSSSGIDATAEDDSIGSATEVGFAIQRVLWDSSAHGLVWIPLAILGAFVVRDRIPWIALGWFVIWLWAWWLWTPRMDRDWVIALPMLAWPVAAGVHWLVRKTGPWVVPILIGINLLWAAVMLPVWPMSDNRVLMPIDALAASHFRWSAEVQGGAGGTETDREDSNSVVEQGRGTLSMPEREDERGLTQNATDGAGQGGSAPNYLGWINQFGQRRLSDVKRILVVGSNDLFEMRYNISASGECDVGVWDRAIALSDDQAMAMFARERISHVVIDWNSLRLRESRTGVYREKDYRDRLRRLIKSGGLNPIDWPILSSQAELFGVNQSKRPGIIATASRETAD